MKSSVGECIGIRPQAVDDAVVNRSRIFLRAAEHHVFEEMGVASAARLDLVAAAGPHDRPVAHQPAAGHGNKYDPQAVGQRLVGSGRERRFRPPRRRRKTAGQARSSSESCEIPRQRHFQQESDWMLAAQPRNVNRL